MEELSKRFQECFIGVVQRGFKDLSEAFKGSFRNVLEGFPEVSEDFIGFRRYPGSFMEGLKEFWVISRSSLDLIDVLFFRYQEVYRKFYRGFRRISIGFTGF